jgi:two-component system, response regulator / RNA-binding antiterminator
VRGRSGHARPNITPEETVVEPVEPKSSLRVLVAGGATPLLGPVARSVTSLGHEVISEQTDLRNVGTVTAAELPDVALVIVGESSADALATIAQIVRDAECPVIAILDVEDRGFIDQAARLGIFAHIVHAEVRTDELQSSIDIALRRFAEYHALQGAFGRRAVTERAKGILMERHSIDEQQAFNMLREQARRTQRKIVDIAGSVIESHRLLANMGDDPTDEPHPGAEPG